MKYTPNLMPVKVLTVRKKRLENEEYGFFYEIWKRRNVKK